MASPWQTFTIPIIDKTSVPILKTIDASAASGAKISVNAKTDIATDPITSIKNKFIPIFALNTKNSLESLSEWQRIQI